MLDMSAANRLPIFQPPSIFILLCFITCCNHSSAHSSSNHAPSCPPSSCGNITDIKYPFRLKTDPESCGYNSTDFELDCLNNQATLWILTDQEDYQMYSVQEINYKEERIRVVDPGINKENHASCPVYERGNSYPLKGFVAFIHCQSPVSSAKYVKGPFCGNTSNMFDNSSRLYTYVTVGGEDRQLRVSDLEESCMVDKVALFSLHRPVMDKSSLTSIYHSLAYGFELTWYMYEGCHGDTSFTLVPTKVVDYFCCWINPNYRCAYILDKVSILAYVGSTLGEILVARLAIGFVIGFPLLMWLVVHKWRRRHLSMYKSIEEFLQDQYNLTPIRYTYSNIKKMTNNFTQKLGEGGYGTVYKGKLRSGIYVAVKMMDQSIASDEEFISEVGTIGQIHHVNVVQLIGFCVERSKFALVYEFLSSGSLDRYIFNQQSLGVLALTFNKMLEIAIGVARGIDYLHHGCNIQILHFDIKPHNILLDEKFNPKISDFGLAQLHPTNESFINLTAARGTIGYMAPEMFYRNIGGISYKADVYSFGMMMMEMAGRRKNLNHLVEDTNQMYFPLWVYDQLCTGKDIEINDATEEERKIVKKIMIVALWCIQIRPSNRPSMNKVIQMLEGESELMMPPKPFVAPHDVAINDDEIIQTYSVDYINLDLGEK